MLGALLSLGVAVALLALGRRHPVALLAATGCAAAALGMARVEVFLYQEARESLAAYAGVSAVVRGSVADDPDRRATGLRVMVDVESVNGSPARGRLLATLPRESAVGYGDRLELRGLVALPQPFETDTGHIFDYPGYLRVRGISALMQRATLREIAPAGISLRGALFSVKHAFERSLESVLPEPRASLMEGILLGERSGLPDALVQAFVIVGLIHVVVLSGSNISIVSEAILRALSWLPRGVALATGAAAIVLFAVMVGGGAATMRAVVMGLIAILARYLRRPSLALRALGVAAVLMLLWNPVVLLHDTGFMLSMLATFGLITLGPKIETQLLRVPLLRSLGEGWRSILATTLGVELFIMPALLYYSGIVSPLSVVANMLALPAIPLAMLLGFVAGALGLLHPVLALVPGLGADLVLRYIVAVAEGVSAVPYSWTTVAAFPAWVAALAYLPLLFIALRPQSARRTRSS